MVDCSQVVQYRVMNMWAIISAINFLAAYKYGKESRSKPQDKTATVKQEGQHTPLLTVST